MNLTVIIRLKEKIAVSTEFTPVERDFVLEAINASLKLAMCTSALISVEKSPELRALLLKAIDAIGFDELEQHIAEMTHTAFRKGCDGGGEVWTAMKQMQRVDRTQWSAAFDWMIYGLRYILGREKP